MLIWAKINTGKAVKMCRWNNISKLLIKLSWLFQPFFIDHIMRATTFIDPRLPVEVPLINPDFLHTPVARGRAARTAEPPASDAVSGHCSGVIVKSGCNCRCLLLGYCAVARTVDSISCMENTVSSPFTGVLDQPVLCASAWGWGSGPSGQDCRQTLLLQM